MFIHNQYHAYAGNLMQQILLCISQFYFSNYVSKQIPIYIQKATLLQVFGLQVQILHVLQANSILLELLPSTLANYF
jgi:hypothetical protein